MYPSESLDTGISIRVIVSGLGSSWRIAELINGFSFVDFHVFRLMRDNLIKINKARGRASDSRVGTIYRVTNHYKSLVFVWL